MIGVGRDADSFDALFKNASLALEMALSRGGDQAVVKDRLNFQFYGGRAKSTEKRTKVKSRVMANALGELISDAARFTSWATAHRTWMSLGAAAGIVAAARKRAKARSSSTPRTTPPPHPGKLVELPEYKDAFITGNDGVIWRTTAPCSSWWTPTVPTSSNPSSCC